MVVQLIIHNPAVSPSHCVTEIKILIRTKPRLFCYKSFARRNLFKTTVNTIDLKLVIQIFT